MLRILTPKILSYRSSFNLASRNMADSMKPVELSIRKKLKETFSPVHMDVLNESYMHNVPKGSETHFKVVVVSDNFTQVPLIKRHRMIMDLLKDELQNGVHALSIVAKTPNQWEDADKNIKPSPNCRGGFGK